MYNIHILDACALIALLRKEKGAEIIADMMEKAESGSVKLYMNTINLLEVYYGFYREMGQRYALNIIQNVEASPIIITAFDDAIFKEAGRVKAENKLSLADAIAVAQTIILKGTLLTSDHHEFNKLEGKEDIYILWIR
jgi:PIN domain nuclease of toxin-antitoxin system